MMEIDSNPNHNVPPIPSANQVITRSPTPNKSNRSPMQSQGSQRVMELPKIHNFDPTATGARNHSRRRKRPPKSRSLASSLATQSMDDLRTPFSYQADPATFRSSGFNAALRRVQIVGVSLPNINGATNVSLPSSEGKQRDRPSTMIKQIPLTQRHGDMWGANEAPSTITKSKNVIIHSDRYQWDEFGNTKAVAQSTAYHPDLTLTAKRYINDQSLPPLAGDSFSFAQKDRMLSEIENQQRIKFIRYKNGVWPHRESQDLLLGGSKLELCERDDVLKELNQLKCVTHMLPTKAKDLYVGRGFQMPKTHMINTARNPSKVIDDPIFQEYLKKNNPTSGSRAPSESGSIVIDKPPTPATSAIPPTSAHSKTPLNNLLMIPNLEQQVSSEQHEKAAAKYQDFIQNNQNYDSELIIDRLSSDLSQGEKKYLTKLCATTLQGSSTISSTGYIALWVMASKIQSYSSSDAVKQCYSKEFSNLDEMLVELVESFQQMDRQNSGEISKDSLMEILASHINKDLNKETGVDDVKNSLFKEGSTNITKLDYLLHLPYFISLSL